MTEVASLPVFLPEWALLLPLSVSLGACLYLSLLCLSVLPLVPGFADLPGDLELLVGPETTLAAMGLYFVGWAVRGHPLVELLWGVGNVGIRFIAVALLGLLVLSGGGSLASAPFLLLAGGIAAYVQLQRVGWIVIDHRGGWIPARRWIQRLGAESIALGLLWLALLHPAVGVVASAVALIVVTVAGRAFHQAGRLAVAVAVGAFRAASGRSGWRTGSAPPGWVRRAREFNDEVGVDSARATRAALVRPGTRPALVYGWLVSFATGPAFLFRSLDRLWDISLERATLESCARRFHMTEIGLEDEVGRLALLVPIGGPGPEELEGIFSAAPSAKNL